MNTVEALQKTKDVLMERGWCKHALEDDEGRVCLVGAMNAAEIGKADVCRSLQGPFLDAYSLLGETVPGSWLSRFNNAPETTFNDVIDLLDEAILLAKEREAA